MILRGRVVSGQKEGADFTQLDWVRTQFKNRLGIDPYPGTLNLRLDEPAELEKWRQVKARGGVVIEPATPQFCQARGFPVLVQRDDTPPESGQRAAIILPDVPGYPDAQVELIAPVHLRKSLELEDGDIVYVEVRVA